MGRCRAAFPAQVLQAVTIKQTLSAIKSFRIVPSFVHPPKGTTKARPGYVHRRLAGKDNEKKETEEPHAADLA